MSVRVPVLNEDGELDADVLPDAIAASTEAATKSNLRIIACEGDSITTGNQDETGVTWPGLLASALGSGVAITNFGKGGWSATEIAILQGGRTVTLGAFTLPTGTGNTAVTVTAPTGPYRPTIAWTGVLDVNGTLVPGILTHTLPANTWTFARSTGGASLSVPAGAQFTCTDHNTYRDAAQIISVGTNNLEPANLATATTVVPAEIDAMIAHLTPEVKRYLVLSIMFTGNSGTTQYNTVQTINNALATTHGNKYVDIRRAMIDRGLQLNAITPTTQDTAAIAADSVPPSLFMPDGIHPNQYGYRLIATVVLERLIALDWLKDKPGSLPAPIISTTPTYQWLASDLAGADGTVVSSWTAKAGGQPLTQADTTKQPTLATVGGKKFVRFDGDNDELLNASPTLPQPYTIVAHLNVRSSPGTQGVLAATPGAGCVVVTTWDGRGKATGASNTIQTPAGQVINGTPTAIAAVYNGATSSVRIGSNAAVTGTLADALAGVRVGYGQDSGFSGAPIDVAEIRVYPIALAQASIDAVIAEMAA